MVGQRVGGWEFLVVMAMRAVRNGKARWSGSTAAVVAVVVGALAVVDVGVAVVGVEAVVVGVVCGRRCSRSGSRCSGR